MVEFVARNSRRESRSFDGDLGHYQVSCTPYTYEHVAKINNNFPVFDYAGPGVVAFMNPDNGEIAMPSPERTPYGAGEHVLRHETLHVYTELAGGHHDERGFNDMAVDQLRQKTGYNFFPFPSY